MKAQKALVTEFLEKHTVEEAWKWLALREADIEEKMEATFFKADTSLYYKMKAYENAKTEDRF